MIYCIVFLILFAELFYIIQGLTWWAINLFMGEELTGLYIFFNFAVPIAVTLFAGWIVYYLTNTVTLLFKRVERR
ncbi:hypothetical protein LF817_09490 [Halobacillus sp. A1]|uniref:hypothetical protein n=1 Tax=Halobacillus sp. A1 TaxID=2880262 RepID=UPI0020A6D48A|nr:hypothetical protein [Halobacillus sp. A1]MCP3031582.1 hypothetical protein [Halobacillus sp. A1]